LLYLNNRRFINVKDLNIIMLAKNYYNIMRKEIFNKSKSKIIIAFLKILKDNNFIYHIRVNIKEDEFNIIITYKLI